LQIEKNLFNNIIIKVFVAIDLGRFLLQWKTLTQNKYSSMAWKNFLQIRKLLETK